MSRGKSFQENVRERGDWQSLPIDERKNTKVLIKKYDEEKITLVCMGDEHIGSQFYDEYTHLKNVEWCYENDAPVILMGDTLETATRDSIGAGVFEQDEIVQEQLEKAERIYRPLAEKGLILGNHIGNHEARVYNYSGANLSKILAKLLKIRYLGVGAISNIRVGDQSYTIYTTHGHSGSRLPHTKIKAVLDLANMIDVEIYAMGHLHALDHHVRNMYVFDKRSKTIKEKQKHFILTGSYLNHWGSYAHISGLEPARKGSPKIKLGGLEHRIRVSL